MKQNGRYFAEHKTLSEVITCFFKLRDVLIFISVLLLAKRQGGFPWILRPIFDNGNKPDGLRKSFNMHLTPESKKQIDLTF